MRKLSDDFYEYEFKCKCCGRLHVEPELIELLQRVRNAYGKKMIVKSGFRCPKHNRDVGGRPYSAHLIGEAVDIKCNSSHTRSVLMELFQAEGINRFGLAKSFLHIDISKTLPQKVTWLY